MRVRSVQPLQPRCCATCEECGYSLEGLAGEGIAEGARSPAACPECGVTFKPDQPWRPDLRPTAWGTFLRLCGPLAALLAMLLVFGVFRATRNWVIWPLSLTWIIAIAILAVPLPIGRARAIARRCEPRMSRPAAVRRIAGPAILLNLAISLLSLLAFFALL